MTSKMRSKTIPNPAQPKTGPPILFVFFWRVQPSIRSRRCNRNTVLPFWYVFNIVPFFINSGSISGPGNWDLAKILKIKPMSKRFSPQKYYFQLPGASQKQKVPRSLPKGTRGGVLGVTFSTKLRFSNLEPTLAQKAKKNELCNMSYQI